MQSYIPIEEGDREKFDCTQKRRGLCSGNRGNQSQREMTMLLTLKMEERA